MEGSPILILTGEIQSGKTTFLQKWINRRNDIAGWLSPVIYGERFFYNIPEQALYNMGKQPDEKQILEVGKFVFSAAIFLKVSEKLIVWANQNKWKYIIIDEIGPLELIKREGLYDALNEIVLMTHTSFRLMLVVRKAMLDMAIKFCSQHNRDVKIFYINEMNESTFQE